MPNLSPAICIQEVTELHQFFQDWFCGDLPNTDAAYARFVTAISPTFKIIAPDGKITQQPALLKGLRAAYNAGAFKIWIENATAHPLRDDLMLVLYEEWQVTNGKQTVRQSTVLFGSNPSAPNGVEWLHVHETWIGGADYAFDHAT